MAKERYQIIPAMYVLVRRPEDGAILFLERANTGYMDGYWSLPAGHLDPNEDFLFCAQREMKEEVGLDGKNFTLRHVHYRESNDGPVPRVCMFFDCHDWTGTPINNEPEKCTRVAFFTLDQLPEKVAPEVRAVMTAIKEGQMLSCAAFDKNTFNHVSRFFPVETI